MSFSLSYSILKFEFINFELEQYLLSLHDVNAFLHLVHALTGKIVYLSLAFGEGWGEAYAVGSILKVEADELLDACRCFSNADLSTVCGNLHAVGLVETNPAGTIIQDVVIVGSIR